MKRACDCAIRVDSRGPCDAPGCVDPSKPLPPEVFRHRVNVRVEGWSEDYGRKPIGESAVLSVDLVFDPAVLGSPVPAEEIQKGLRRSMDEMVGMIVNAWRDAREAGK